MLSATGTFCDLLNGLANNLPSTLSPDDPSVLQALALAAYAATAAADGPAAEDWKSFGCSSSEVIVYCGMAPPR